MSSQAFKPLTENSPHQFNDAMEHQILLYEIMLELQQAERFSDVFPDVEDKLKTLLHTEHVLVYKRGRNKRELTTSIISGGKRQDIRLDFSPASIAGYVAMTGKPVCIQNLHDARALQAIYPSLQNNSEADEKLGIDSYSTLAVPIYHNEIVIGVLQLINRVDGSFSTMEYRKVTSLALMLGEHFYSELGMSESPYDLLIQRGLLTREDLEEATINATTNDVSLAWYLVTEKGLPVEDVGESMESYYQIPFMRYDINIKVPSKIIEDINPEYIRRQGWVPIADNGVEVTILIDDPTDTQKIMDIERIFREQKIKLFLMMPEDIASIADAVASDNWETHSVEELTNLADNDIQGRGQARDGSSSQGEDSGVVLLLNRIITDAYRKGASDIHIQPAGDSKPAAVLYRIDGVCRPVTRIPHKLVLPVTARLKVMCSMDLAEKRLPQDGKCSIKCRGKRLDLRVAIIPNVHGLETTVMRLLSNCEAMHLYGLGLSEQNLNRVKQLAGKPHGLFLVVGPTGSGKTTTLHSIVGHINKGERVIWTVEDPVEITQPGLQQVSINTRQGLTFARVLRSLLRADPDVILVGEMRDEETAQIAVDASMTGHLVLSTLHTNSAADTIERLFGMGASPFSLADSLAGILSQRLVRRLCSDCKQKYKPEEVEYEYLKKTIETEHPDLAGDFTTDTLLTKPVGCDKCDQTGYQGRVGLHEVLPVSRGISHLIASRASCEKTEALARREGMVTLGGDALEKLLMGEIDLSQLHKIGI